MINVRCGLGALSITAVSGRVNTNNEVRPGPFWNARPSVRDNHHVLDCQPMCLLGLGEDKIQSFAQHANRAHNYSGSASCKHVLVICMLQGKDLDYFPSLF